MKPILFVKCYDPSKKKDVEHKITPFILSDESIAKFWNSARQYPHLFGRAVPPTQAEFLKLYFSVGVDGLLYTDHLIWVVDDFRGIIALTNISYPDDALMHFTFFDGRLRGRAPLLREMIQYVFREFDLYRLSAEIPTYVTSKTKSGSGLLKFISHEVGLKLEGRKEKAVQYTGKDGTTDRFDVLLYGITSEDMKQWELQRQKSWEEDQQQMSEISSVAG
jgi:hypothetical protein